MSGQSAAFATRNTSITTAADPVPLPEVMTNYGNLWKADTHSFYMPAMEGIFYIVINSAVVPASTSMDFKLVKNNSPFTHCGTTWSPENDRYTQNKDIVSRLEVGDTLHASTSTGVYSDWHFYPAVGVTSLSEAMDPLEDLVIFSVARNVTVSGPLNPLPFDVELVNDEWYYDIFSHTFFAPSNGVYWFSFSVGLQAGQGTEFTLYKNDEPYMNILRTSTTHAGIEQISRSVLIELNFLDTIHIVNGNSSARSSDLLETTFSGFKYQPVHDTPVSITLFHISFRKGKLVLYPRNMYIWGSLFALSDNTTAHHFFSAASK